MLAVQIVSILEARVGCRGAGYIRGVIMTFKTNFCIWNRRIIAARVDRRVIRFYSSTAIKNVQKRRTMRAVCASGRCGIGMTICTIGAAVHIPTSRKTSSGHGCIFACCHQRMITCIGRVEGGRQITRVFNLCRICTGKFSQTVGHVSPCAAIRNTTPTFRQVRWQSGVTGMTL